MSVCALFALRRTTIVRLCTQTDRRSDHNRQTQSNPSHVPARPVVLTRPVRLPSRPVLSPSGCVPSPSRPRPVLLCPVPSRHVTSRPVLLRCVPSRPVVLRGGYVQSRRGPGDCRAAWLSEERASVARSRSIDQDQATEALSRVFSTIRTVSTYRSVARHIFLSVKKIAS